MSSTTHDLDSGNDQGTQKKYIGRSTAFLYLMHGEPFYKKRARCIYLDSYKRKQIVVVCIL